MVNEPSRDWPVSGLRGGSLRKETKYKKTLVITTGQIIWPVCLRWSLRAGDPTGRLPKTNLTTTTRVTMAIRLLFYSGLLWDLGEQDIATALVGLPVKDNAAVRRYAQAGGNRDRLFIYQ